MDNTQTDTAAFPDAIQDQTIEALGIDPARDTYEELIEITLTDAEKAERRERLESVDREIIRLEIEKKAAMKVFTNQIKPLEAERESILETLDSGTERKPVECYEHLVQDGANILALQGDLFSSSGSSNPPPAAEDDDQDAGGADDFEPSPEALAQAATDEGRVVKTNAKAVKAKKAKRKGSKGK